MFHHLRHAWLRIVLVLTVAAASVTFASPAYALPTIGNGVCDSGNVCMWQFANFKGSLLDAKGCEPNWYCGLGDFSQWWYFNTTTSPDNRTSSLWHRNGTYPWAMFAQYTYGGGQRTCWPQGVQSDGTFLSAEGMDDKISSMWTSTIDECSL